MKNLMAKPFDQYDWFSSELVFAMAFSDDEERILVGTKTGIFSRLKQEGTPVLLPDDVVPYGIVQILDALKLLVGDSLSLVANALSSGPVMAMRNENRVLHERFQKEIQLLCDKSYAIGHFLLNFERDPEKKWDVAIDALVAALRESGKQSQKEEMRAKDFLQSRWDTKDPVCQFAALKIWQGYCAVRQSKKEIARGVIRSQTEDFPQLIDIFSFSAKRLTDSFWQNPDAKPDVKTKVIAGNDPILRLPPRVKSFEDELRVWTIDGVNFELAVVSGSFYPMKQYCRLRMNERGMKFAQCIVCGDYFPTSTRKKKTCGKICAGLRKLQTTDDYRKKSEGDKVELLRSQAYQYWYNRVKKAERIEVFPAEQLTKLMDAFEKFKCELKNRKKKVVEGDITLGEFSAWILLQEQRASEIMGEFEKRWYGEA